MKYPLFLTLILFTIITSCDCGIDKKELLFTKAELIHFSSFKASDTIVYAHASGKRDSIIVREVTEHDENPEVYCGILSMRPTNHKSVFIEHIPKNIWPRSHWKTHDSLAQVKGFQDMFNISIYPNPRQVDLGVSFKNFIFNGNGYKNLWVKKDTSIGKWSIKSFYKLPHSYPERIKHPTDIVQVYWNQKVGLIAYRNKKGEVFIKT